MNGICYCDSVKNKDREGESLKAEEHNDAVFCRLS